MKKTSIISALFFGLLITSSCKRNEPIVSVVIDIEMDISVKSADGKDLLDPKTPGHIAEQDIRIYHLADGKPVEGYVPNWNAPRGFSILTDASERKVARVDGDILNMDEYATTYVKWSEADTDTLKYRIEREGKHYTVITKIWCNGSEVWEQGKGKDDLAFDIIKK